MKMIKISITSMKFYQCKNSTMDSNYHYLYNVDFWL